jgi:hypothetical protein
MAIDHELSTEIATALLTGKKRTPRELKDLKETVVRVYLTLQQLAAQSRPSRDLFRVPRDQKKPVSG